MTLPNFIIIGQMKAGTTSLHAYMRQHPQIFLPALKEARFFSERIDDPTRPSWNTKGLPATLEEYEKLFEPVTDEIAIGEASPDYLQSDHAAPQIKRCLPSVRLIVSLRRPSDRLYSSYLMARRNGREEREFDAVFRERKGRPQVAGTSAYEALKRYYDLFGSPQIQAIRFDDLANQLSATLQTLFRFLGVDAHFEPDTSEIYNKGGVWRSPKMGRVATAIISNRLLMARLKRLAPSGVWRIAKNAHNRNIVKAPSLTAEMRHEVSAFFREDTLKIQELVGLDLSDWLAE